MKRQTAKIATDQTRERLIDAGIRLFAANGFNATSLADISNELNVTKQALLYHFESKEQLYGEVLRQISERLFRFVPGQGQVNYDPALQLEHMILRIFRTAMLNKNDMRILMREILDNPERASTARFWPLKTFFDGVTALAKANPQLANVSDTLVLTFVYQVLGSILCFSISSPTLKSMYGTESYSIVRDHFPIELQNHIRWFLAAAEKENSGK